MNATTPAATASARILIAFAVWAPAAVVMADDAAAWREPLSVEMPETTLDFSAGRAVDSAMLLQGNGFGPRVIAPAGHDRQVVEVAARDESECRQHGADSCQPSQCQVISQVIDEGLAGPGAMAELVVHTDPQVRARLVRKPPDLGLFLAAVAPNHCLDSRDMDVAATQMRPGPGRLTLDGAAIPEDTTCYDLSLTSRCASVMVPLSSVVPAVAPGRVLTILRGVTAESLAQTTGLQPLWTTRLDTTSTVLDVFAIPDGRSTFEVVEQLRTIPGVRAQADYVYETTAVYADPLTRADYSARRTGASRLHYETQGDGITIALIDTGVDLDHPEIKDRIASHQTTMRGEWMADVHGTAVAGVIAATANDAEGSVGVAPQVEILALKACQAAGPGKLASRCWSSSLVKALDLAIASEAQVINLGMAGPPDELVQEYVDLAVAGGAIVVAAAGKGGVGAKPAFPAAMANVVAVTAVDRADHLFKNANVGDYIDVAAPGVGIVAPAPGGIHPLMSGTSMAAAHVSGVIALLRPLTPLASTRELLAEIENSASDLGERGVDSLFGAGLVDVCAAAARVSGEAVICRDE